MLLCIRCTELPGLAQTPDSSTWTWPVPAQSDWTDYGTILEPGALGEWDYQLFGGFALSAIKKDGTYFLYYQGASGYRIADDTVTWRAVGVATSLDGVNFTKHPGNPVLTWFPNNNGEEGAVSTGATMDDSGDVVIYYGANTEQNAAKVHADGRLAASSDGLSFTDLGVVLDHQDGSLWGSGDELFPIIAFHDSGQWFVYYLPNGTPMARQLGVAWGNSRDDLSNSAGARSGASPIPAWGPGGYAKVDPETYVLFLNDAPQIEARSVSTNSPNVLSGVIDAYEFDEVEHATVFLDHESSTWFMYYRIKDNRGYGVRLAPAGEPDTTPPTTPANVAATPVSDRQVELSWSPATEQETGIVLYKVFRDGVPLTTVKGWSFNDDTLTEQTTHNYQVAAINYHGIEGPRSAPVSATTLVDIALPQIVSVNAGASGDVTVVFSEPVEKTSAEMVTNYVIDRGVQVSAASLDADLKTVRLATSGHRRSRTYTIAVKGVRDRAAIPNAIASTEVKYMYSGVAGLAGAWRLDEGVGNTAFDSANYGSNGFLIYTSQPGPSWTNGRVGTALQFDGSDDQVTIDGAGSLHAVTDEGHTFSAWVMPQIVPPFTTANDVFFSILVRDYTGLYYDHNGKYKAQIRLMDGTELVVLSDALDPGIWHHVAMVVDSEGKKLHLYVDGQEIADSPVTYNGTLAELHDASYYIGTSDPLTERYEYRFKGKIDEVLIFDRALTTAEIQLLFASLHYSLHTLLPLISK